MSWLNFNDSLNSLKGQITNFASNVLAEDEDQQLSTDELKRICQQQEEEIEKLKKLNRELEFREKNASGDGPEGSWNWENAEENESETALKEKIRALETEKSELLQRLEQLDADNQENLLNIMRIKDRLQLELSAASQNYGKLLEENEILKAKGDEPTPIFNRELEELKKELMVTKSSNENFQKIAEQTKSANADLEEKINKLECESKLIYAELKKSNEQIRFFEKKSIEDEDNCQKLAFILESYETQVNALKENINELTAKYEESQKQHEDVQKKYQNDIIYLKEEINNSKVSNQDEEIERYKEEINILKQQTEELRLKSQGRMDVELEDELVAIQEEHEAQLNVIREDLEQLKDHQSTMQQIDDYKMEIENLKKINDELLADKTNEDLFEKYQNAIYEIEQLRQQKNADKEELRKIQEEHQVQLKELQELKIKENNQENCLQQEINSYKEEIKKLTQQNEELLAKSSAKIDVDLEDELVQIREDYETQLNILREELEELKKDDTLHEEIEDLKRENTDISKQLAEAIDNNKKLEETCNELQQTHLQLHNKYINIITENIKKFQECEKPSDFQHCAREDDPQAAELSKHIENIIKILLDLKCKSLDLEKRILEITDEKNAMLVEKNREIEKLIRNSDMLSQEIVAKNQTIKEYETECNELAKNNEVLISELETLKSNPVLQTISESNEDNMILLESQLETANRRIEELEKSIGNRDDRIDYQKLLSNYDQLQVNYDSLRKEFDENKENLSASAEKNLNLQAALEKLKNEYEMFEYQINELNVNSESLQQEVDEFKAKFNALLKENSRIKLDNQELAKNSALIESLEGRLATEVETKRSFEAQLETVTEKLKNCKMSETTLKLQCEQKSKELADQSEARYNLELSLNKINADLAKYQNNFADLQSDNDKLRSELDQLHETLATKNELIGELEEKNKLEHELKMPNDKSPNNDEEYNKLKRILDETVLEKANLHSQLNKLAELQSQLKETTDRGAALQQQLQEVTNSRNELINMVTMKHQENVTYHNEIQRLNQILTTEHERYKNLEKQLNDVQAKVSEEDLQNKDKKIEELTDRNNFLKEKCEVIAKNLLEEQSTVQQLLSERSQPSDNERTLQKNLDRLQAHLIELEEHYTQEQYQAEQKNQALRAKVSELEEREKSSSTMYTSVSVRANQQVESLQNQLQNALQERDSLRKRISDAEDENTKQAAALANLQFVLEQFRKDKEKDVIKETERIRRHIGAEKLVQEELRAEISGLRAQLEERNQGLLAASRLSDQLESSKKTVVGLKEEVSQLQTKLSRAEEDVKTALSTTDGKVDKLLIKNLIVGFVTSNNNFTKDQMQILKIIATVLDFNQQDHDKVKLNKPQQGWLGSFLAPQALPDSQNRMNEESLSRAFIKFLENESKPRVVPSLLNESSVSEASTTKTTNSRSTTPSQTPIVLSEIVLPTFNDFAQNRNSSSILKDVLKDNN
ncbi:unnamed protein product [Phyllotreta striolata]|uniref:GRIP domain-containing protein n=1 Tax=Phyllotreta striolata TaxID=444603 RepID=A0A9N9XLG4_PHYSR|nr:unnamed protein product [Phyllotreta striolata]